MLNSRRIKGGYKNENSGKKWSKDELRIVLDLYVKDRNLKIHESNPVICELGSQLGRTTRSVEAQLLMFKNLDRFGLTSFHKMSTLCNVLWKEYIQNHSEQI
ncbi:MAG: hypothetical protein EOP48_00615 [Sphingobacteriales bacterium]|nr:MAG: hypothetical protein EOP48_00615 [Sphingobacteriales bacterium]